MIPARAFRSVEQSRENARMYLELEIGSEGLITGYTELMIRASTYLVETVSMPQIEEETLVQS